MTKRAPFKYFKTSREIIRLSVMMHVRFPLTLRNVEDLLHERGIETSNESVLFWWNRFGPTFASEIRRKRAERLRSGPQWQWHVDEMFVKVNGERHYLWRAVDHGGEVLQGGVKLSSSMGAGRRLASPTACCALLASTGPRPTSIPYPVARDLWP